MGKMNGTGKMLEEAVVALQGAIDEVVPPDAQTHLMAAQRELILAIAITIDYHANRSSGKNPPKTGKKSGRESAKRSAASKPKRIRLD